MVFDATVSSLLLVAGLLAGGLFAFIFGLCCYILGGYGLYRLAEGQGVRPSWLAWFPIARFYLFGCVGAEYAHAAPKSVSRRLLVWGFPAFSLLSFLTGWQGFISFLASGTSLSSSGQLIRLFLWSSSLHAALRLLCLLLSLRALFPILLRLRPQNAALLCALCLPLWPLRWVLLFLCGRWSAQADQQSRQGAEISTQDWLATLAEAGKKPSSDDFFPQE